MRPQSPTAPVSTTTLDSLALGLDPFPSAYFDNLNNYLLEVSGIYERTFPKDVTLEMTRYYISGLDEVLSGLDRMLPMLQCTMSKLKLSVAPLRELRQRAFVAANRLVKKENRPAVQLPTEVLQLISSFAYPPLGRNRFAQLTRVPRCAWSQIVLSQAELWFQCYSFRGHGYSRASALLEESARVVGSGGMKMVVVVGFRSNVHPGYIGLALRYFNRWVELSLDTLVHDTCDRLAKEELAMSRLKRLSISSPHLRCLSIQCLFPRINYLRIWFKRDERGYGSEWVRVLEGAVNLRTLEMEFEQVMHTPPHETKEDTTSPKIILPNLRTFSINQPQSYLMDLAQLTFIVGDLGLDCGLVERVGFFCLNANSGVRVDDADKHCKLGGLVRTMSRKFPRLGELVIAKAGVVCNYERQAMVLVQCSVLSDLGPEGDLEPLFPNLTSLTLFVEYTRRGFFSIYNFVLSRLSASRATRTKRLQSITLVGDVPKDDPLEFVGILQTMVPNVTVTRL